MEKERFSMLLLEPGEVYFEDFRSTLLAKSMSLQGKESNEQDGRLKLCSKSVVFEPKNVMKPILKIMLKHCTKLDLISDSKSKSALYSKISSNNRIIIECCQHVQMLEGNAVAPYEFHHEPVQFELTLNYSGVRDCLAKITQLQRASTLPLPEQNLMISAITFSRQSRCSFDNLWLGDLYEEIILETQGKKVTPLVMNPGRIVLTTAALYFQPFNNVETQPVTKVKLELIRRIIKRRFLLQQLGVELYCSEAAPVSHLYLTFVSSQKRDELYDAICAQPAVKLQDDQQEAVILQWQHGVISNYDYLLYLNSVADRTFNDLTQYPVFPWVIADYVSPSLNLDSPSTYRDLTKPMGALNEVRFKNLKERYDDMPEPKFLYGSHYSTPGFVLFYLVRKFPQYMLCLQNGRFDHPDRMFNSVPDVWRNVLSSNTDFKELVPEFYDTRNKGDFLTNMYGVNFGRRQNGSSVDDVTLPPWADDPLDFIKKMREALESDYVSKNLHHWIDLIFGHKQRGEEAVIANNVFYHLCYEGSVDLEGETDEVKKHALEIQIMEFGQIPKQVFSRPHPERFLSSPAKPLPAGISGGGIPQTIPSVSCYELSAKIKCHRGAVTAMKFMENEADVVATVGEDSLLKCHSLRDNQQVHSVPLGCAPLTDVAILPQSKRLVVSSQNASVYIYDLEFGRIVEEVEAHHDAVTRVAWSKDPYNGILVTGSNDECVMIWKGLRTGEPWRKLSRTIPMELEHESPITCVALNGDDTLLGTGCQDGSVYLWSLEHIKLYQKFEKHEGAVGAVSFCNDFSQLATCGAVDGILRIIDLSTAVTVCFKELGEGIRSIFWMSSTIVLGTVLGKIIVWDVRHANVVQMSPVHQGPTLCVALSNDGHTLVSGGEDGFLSVWEGINNH